MKVLISEDCQTSLTIEDIDFLINAISFFDLMLKKSLNSFSEIVEEISNFLDFKEPYNFYVSRCEIDCNRVEITVSKKFDNISASFKKSSNFYLFSINGSIFDVNKIKKIIEMAMTDEEKIK